MKAGRPFSRSVGLPSFLAGRLKRNRKVWSAFAHSEWVHYTMVGLLVMGPLLASGYIFVLDMVFAPTMPMPNQVSNNYLFGVMLHLLTLVFPGDLVQKTLLLAILALAGVGMHRWVCVLQKPELGRIAWPAYAAGLFYVLNPFVYSRFMAGQYLVLLGYALLPFFGRWLWQLFRTPSWRSGVKVGLLATVIGIVSIHAVGIMVVLALVVGMGALWQVRHNKSKLQKFIRFSALALVLFLLLSSYWLVPLLMNRGPTADTLQDFTVADQMAFATEGVGAFGKIVSVIKLQGFWLEGQALFMLPQEKFGAWGIVLLSCWAVAITGVVAAWRVGHRQLAVVMVMLVVLGVWLGSGISQLWFAAHMPFMQGYRDPHKFTALLVLGLGLGIGFGVKFFFEKLVMQPTVLACAKLAVIVLPILLVPTMLWGFNGQLHTAHYPIGWYQARSFLGQDHSAYKVLFVPWHQYMYFNFAGSLVANPAPKFFNRPFIISQDPEFEALTAPPTNESTKVGQLLHVPQPQLGSQLKQYSVKYIVRAKELDYNKYDFFATHKDFHLVFENESLQLYQNQAYKGE